jgi:hypothetical protein
VHWKILNTLSRKITYVQILRKLMKTFVNEKYNSLYCQQQTSLWYQSKKYINSNYKNKQSCVLTRLVVILIHQRVKHLWRLEPAWIVYQTTLHTSVVTKCATIFYSIFLPRKEKHHHTAFTSVRVCLPSWIPESGERFSLNFVQTLYQRTTLQHRASQFPIIPCHKMAVAQTCEVGMT